MRFKVYWEAAQMSLYIYGSVIEHLKPNLTYLKNELIPPGTSIVKWMSHPNFQQEFTLLQLPLLRRGESYHFSLRGKSVPDHSVLIKVSCFTRSGQMVSTEVVPMTGGGIFYPEQAFSYTIELIGIGVKEFLFDHLLICSEPQEAQVSPRSTHSKKRRRLKRRKGRIWKK